MLLFLHGFLGQKEDWDPVLSILGRGFAIDLPKFQEDIALAISQQVESVDYLIGYSAGGRIALELHSRFPKQFPKVVALSAHPGLFDPEERALRKKADQQWIDLLENAPFEQFLKMWYDQPLFAPLKKSPHFHEMLARRKTQNPKAWAHFLRYHGLGEKLPQETSEGTIFVYGSEDLKYAQLYRRLNAHSIKNCGHCPHLEDPHSCAKLIEEIAIDNSKDESPPYLEPGETVPRH